MVIASQQTYTKHDTTDSMALAGVEIDHVMALSRLSSIE